MAEGIRVCLACRGRGAVGGDEAVVCPTCSGFGRVPLRNPVGVAAVHQEGAAA